MMKLWRGILSLLGVIGGTTQASPPEAPIDSTVRVQLKNLEPGPIKHERLSEDLYNRAEAIRVSLSGLLATPRDEWIEGFRRDRNPEREILIWEAIVAALNQYREENKTLTREEQSEAFGLLLARSGESTESVLKNTPLKLLSRKEAEVLLSMYQLSPKPVTIMSK